MSEKIIYIPKPEWWDRGTEGNEVRETARQAYEEALEDASKAMGVIIKIED